MNSPRVQFYSYELQDSAKVEAKVDSVDHQVIDELEDGVEEVKVQVIFH